MSCDAKIWQIDKTLYAIHDGECRLEHHRGSVYDLKGFIDDINICMARHPIVSWHFTVFKDRQGTFPGLKGYTY